MSGARESTKRKRGRPAGFPAEKRSKPAPRDDDSDRDQFPSSDPTASKLVSKHQEALSAYEKTSPLTHQLLRRLTAHSGLQQRSQQEPVLQQTMDVARKLMMTELELVVWALHLTRAPLTPVLSLQSTLLISAFYIKLTLGADIASLQAYLEKHTRDFGKHLDVWEQLNPKETVRFSLQEVNVKWKELKQPVSEEDMTVINYNYYVDDILQAGITPVDQFTSNDSKPQWLNSPIRTPKSAPPSVACELTFAKECEEFPYSLQWFESVPLSPGLLFFNFPSPLPSALLQPMDEQLFAPQTHFPTH